jgi:hypothetical protein
MIYLLPALIGGTLLAVAGLILAARERRAAPQDDAKQLRIPYPKRA